MSRGPISTGRPAAGLALRAALWRAGLGRPRARAIAWQPQPPWPGDAAAARRLAGGVLLLDGALAEAPGRSPWDVAAPGPGWAAALHGHGWLDDAAASTDAPVRAALKGWVFDWITRFGSGRGPDRSLIWAPELVARRLMRWIGHAPLLLSGAGREASAAFFDALGRHAGHLAAIWRRTPAGTQRIEALAGLVYAGLSLEGQDRLAETAIGALAEELARLVDGEGAIPSRNPEDLAGLLELVLWTSGTIAESGRRVDHRLPAAVERLAPVLRALRHPDGTPARFHGARGLAPGRAAAILAAAGVRLAAPGESVMGYLAMADGPIALILDGAPCPPGGHDSALAFEIALGGRPAIVSAGSGAGFGAEVLAWSRSAAAHSGVALGDGASEANAPAPVRASRLRDGAGLWCLGASEARRAGLGLLHERRLLLAKGGTRLAGEETALAPAAEDRARFARLWPEGAACPMRVRFLLHPSVRAAPALAGRAAVLTLADGARWMLRQSGGTMAIGETRFLEPGRLAPRPTREVLITGRVTENWGRVTWSLERLDGDVIPAPSPAALFRGAPGDTV